MLVSDFLAKSLARNARRQMDYSHHSTRQILTQKHDKISTMEFRRGIGASSGLSRVLGFSAASYHTHYYVCPAAWSHWGTKNRPGPSPHVQVVGMPFKARQIFAKMRKSRHTSHSL